MNLCEAVAEAAKQNRAIRRACWSSGACCHSNGSLLWHSRDGGIYGHMLNLSANDWELSTTHHWDGTPIKQPSELESLRAENKRLADELQQLRSKSILPPSGIPAGGNRY